MARTLNPAVHTVRKEAFVDVAQRLIQTKGYEQMSIQDVLDELGTSRGAFYHYFESKQALLGAVVDRMVDAGLAAVAPLVDDQNLSAIEKFEGVFRDIARFKAERVQLVMAILEVWISDDNAIVREKFRRTTIKRLVPLLSPIVKQGMDAGEFSPGSPDEVAHILVRLIEGFRDDATELFLARQANKIDFDAVVRSVGANTQAFERILGASAGSLKLIDVPTLQFWFG